MPKIADAAVVAIHLETAIQLLRLERIVRLKQLAGSRRRRSRCRNRSPCSGSPRHARTPGRSQRHAIGRLERDRGGQVDDLHVGGQRTVAPTQPASYSVFRPNGAPIEKPRVMPERALHRDHDRHVRTRVASPRVAAIATGQRRAASQHVAAAVELGGTGQSPSGRTAMGDLVEVGHRGGLRATFDASCRRCCRRWTCRGS